MSSGWRVTIFSVIEHAHHLQRTERADITVKISSTDDGINVRAEEKEWEILTAGTVAEDVSGGVHAHC